MQCHLINFTSLIFPNRTSMGIFFTRPQAPTPCELWFHVAVRYFFVNPLDIFAIHLSLKAQKTWLWLKDTNLGHKTTVKHLVHDTNMIWLGLQIQFLTFRPQHKYVLVWNHRANFKHSNRDTNMMLLSNIKPILIFSPKINIPPSTQT